VRVARSASQQFGRALTVTSNLALWAAGRFAAVSRRYNAALDRRATAKPGPRPATPPRAESERIIWFHSLDLGDAEPTRGAKSVETLQTQTRHLSLPARLDGKRVLDIGSWDGYFSFEMERRGAASVTALDHYAWAVDHRRYQAYYLEATAAGEPIRPPDETPEAWDPENLPGRAGFDLARTALKSRVEPVVGDFMAMDLAPLGQFDLVLFLGVLYHLKDPFLALRRLRQVTRRRGLAIIETAVVAIPGWVADPLWVFFEGAELNQDASNWWAPTIGGLTAMCRAAGFANTSVIATPPEYEPPPPGSPVHYGRAIVHAR
jgi:tRNA (mo5U34)-methyltransferase